MEKELADFVTEDFAKPRMLDLFSGTGSVTQVFEEKGYEVIS